MKNRDKIVDAAKEFENWVIVSSKSGVDEEFGFPIGKFLCKNHEDVQLVIKNNNIHDPIIISYEVYK